MSNADLIVRARQIAVMEGGCELEIRQILRDLAAALERADEKLASSANVTRKLNELCAIDGVRAVLKDFQADDFEGLSVHLTAIAISHAHQLDRLRTMHAEQDARRYRFWEAHPRSYFIVCVDQKGNLILKMESCPAQKWDKAFGRDNVRAAIDAEIAKEEKRG